MSNAFNRLTDEQLNSALAKLLAPRLAEVLAQRAPGHCMRVTDLDDSVMESVCAELRRDRPDDQTFILGGHGEEDRPFRVTSTKLVELRNPDENGNLRPPLLVFIPNSLRTSAEDSFGVATFEELSLGSVYEDLADELLQQVPATLAAVVRVVLHGLSEEGWPFADDVSQARYLLTALENGIDGETLGASLYELALIPDFKLFADPDRAPLRVLRNLMSVRGLMGSDKALRASLKTPTRTAVLGPWGSIRGKILALGLSDRNLEAKLAAFFDKYNAPEPERWTAHIATDKTWWPISFDKWEFTEELFQDKISVVVGPTDLPTIEQTETNPALLGLIGQQVLAPATRRKLGLSFEVNPHPTRVSGLDHFTVQIVSREGGPVGKTKKVKAWTQKRTSATVSITGLNKIEFEEGWHFVRVIPRGANGEPIPLEGAVSTDTSIPDKAPDNESEPFYVLPGETIDEDPPQRALPIEQSLEHARFKQQLTALGDDRDPAEVAVTGVAWAEGPQVRRSARQDTLLVKFGKEGTHQIPVSRLLKSAEQTILSHAAQPSAWRMQITRDKAEPITAEPVTLPSSTAMKSFLAARAEFFNAIRRDGAELICQGFDYRSAEQVCGAYAEAYLDLLGALMKKAESTTGAERQQHLQSLRSVLAIDSVHIVISDFRGEHREAALVSPTHPLRSLWVAGWTTLGQRWIGQVQQSRIRQYISFVREALFERLIPAGFPVAVPVQDGRVFTPVSDLNDFWSLCAPTTEANPRGLLSEVCSALGISEPSGDASDMPARMVADKVERYLSQHPYVRELSLNVFNAGAGVLVADLLVELQKKAEHADLRYDIRLFAPDPNSPILGEAIEALQHPDVSTVNQAADAFAKSSGSHLFSKLNIAKHAITEFHANTAAFAAHISIMLDVFPAEKLSVADAEPGVTPMFGLIQDYQTVFTDDESGTFWSKSPVVGTPAVSPDGVSTLDLLPVMSRSLAFATSAVAAAGANFRAVPVVTLGLDLTERELIYDVHQASDWVFTVDRNMGIEFFDHGGRKNRPDYLIDYVPRSSQATHNLIISARSNDELEAMLRPVLQQHGLQASVDQAIHVLASLRSLSGQLALKLISAPTQQAEALGLALARLYLEYQGALDNQIILPLDAHTDLYHSSGDTDDQTEGISLQRTDLALFDLDLASRTITCNLVEVKCYSQVGDFAAYNQLKERIAGQVNQSERILQRHFDPAMKTPDRPDRLLKSRELAQLLGFYLSRSERYGLLDPMAAQEARSLLESIEQGYSLQFRRSALIFDFDKTGTEPPDNEVGIEYHRVGKDLIAALLANCRRPTADPTGEHETTSHLLGPDPIPEVPKLESAAFIAPERERTTVWTNSQVWDTPIVATEASSAPQPVPAEEPVEEPEEQLEAEPSDNNTTEGGGSAVGTDASPEPTPPEPASQDEQPASDLPTSPQTPQRVASAQEELPISPESPEDAAVGYDVVLGVTGPTPQYGLLGEVSGRKVALDLNHTHTISLFGVQGGGKSYTLGTVIEMACAPIPEVNVLPSPLAGVIFHYSPTQDYAPEFTSMVRPNTVEAETALLRERYGAEPQALSDILILTPADKVDARRAEFPDIEVRPIAFSASELKAAHWKFLMGAIGSQSLYMRQVNLIMRGLRNNLTLDALRSGIDASALSDHLKDLARTRLDFASEYIDDTQRLQDLIRPGRLIIVDLRDEFIEKDEALGLFVVMLQVFSEATHEGKAFNKLVVFDEAHKYIESDDLVAGLVEVVREMRHKGTSIMVASQDPPSVPVSLIELSSQIIMHKFNSPAWLKHIQKANAALGELTPERMSHLGTGEAYVWSSKASDDSFARGAVKVKLRPRVTQHGGSTKTALGD
jgi:hypothetical protein